MMLPSRSARNFFTQSRARAPGDGLGAGPPGGVSAGALPAATAIARGECLQVRLRSALGLLDARASAGALVAALGAAVRNDRRLVQELQAGVDVRDAAQVLRRFVHVELHDRQEALQVGLLVDREVDLARGEQLLGHRRQVVAAALPSLGAQPLLLDRLREALSRA